MLTTTTRTRVISSSWSSTSSGGLCGGHRASEPRAARPNAEERYNASPRQTVAGEVNFNVCRWTFRARGCATSPLVSHDAGHQRLVGLDQEHHRQNLYLSAYCGGAHYNDMDKQ
jgi:hypothetical protein